MFLSLNPLAQKVGEKMARKEGKILKISGGAVSLYLPADVKHLHDLARMNPNINCSELYSVALRSALGESETKHPMELMVENQKKEVEQIQEDLEAAQKRLASSEGRLPLELAKADYMRNLLGQNGLTQLRQLRIFLFFDATINVSPMPRSGSEALATYKELLSKYEQTKRGPVAGQEFQIIDNLHPEHLITNEGYHCCEIDGTCGMNERKSVDGRWQTIHHHDTMGTHLCDDLKYRCSNHWNIRKLKHQGKENAPTGVKTVSRLKPHWEEEELTSEQIALSQSKQTIHKDEGFLAQEEKALTSYRANSVIQWAIKSWGIENLQQKQILDQLQKQKETTVRDESGNNLPTWAGMPSGINDNLKNRMRVINGMTEQEKDDYKKELQRYESLVKSRGAYIFSKVSEWRKSGEIWPYPLMEDWNDDDPIYTSVMVCNEKVSYDAITSTIYNSIVFDMNTCDSYNPSKTIEPEIKGGMSLSQLRNQLNNH
jgi:hypothetical protein